MKYTTMYLKDLFSKIFKRNVKLITTFLLFHELLIELYIKSFLKDQHKGTKGKLTNTYFQISTKVVKF